MEKEILKEKLEMLKEKLKTLKDLKFKNTAKITVGVTLVLFWSMLMYSCGMNNETNNCVNLSGLWVEKNYLFFSLLPLGDHNIPGLSFEDILFLLFLLQPSYDACYIKL